MFIDYIPLMLINMAAGLFLLACFVIKWPDTSDQKIWFTGFFMVGIIALISGLHMSWNWPLPGSYNIAFGEMSVLFGIIFMGAGFSLFYGLSLVPVVIYAFFAGVAAVIIGFRILDLKMTREPFISGIGFILTGLSGMLAPLYLRLWRNKTSRFIAAVVIIFAAIIWLRAGYMAYWTHLSDLSQWKPLTLR